MPKDQQPRRWPARIDYSKAIRVPRSCFVDRELKAAQTAINEKNNLPITRSGQFAQVFRVTTRARRFGRHAAGAEFAIKCFVRNEEHRDRRCRTLSASLSQRPSGWSVPFVFQDPGIRVNGSAWPIVKMRWIDGTALNRFIAGHLDDRRQLFELARRFRAVVGDLDARGWAHGDLQHGNILVMADGEVRLVDYDGMYVPALADTGSAEVGHPNYQHPARIAGAAELYGPEMDRYAAWLIYGSILLCAHDPQSWARYDGGDNKLLLDASDLRDPGDSPALREWSESNCEHVRQIARALTGVLQKPPGATPPLRRMLAEETQPDPDGQNHAVASSATGTAVGTQTATGADGPWQRPRDPEVSQRRRHWSGGRTIFTFAVGLIIAAVAGILSGAFSPAGNSSPGGTPSTSSISVRSENPPATAAPSSSAAAAATAPFRAGSYQGTTTQGQKISFSATAGNLAEVSQLRIRLHTVCSDSGPETGFVGGAPLAATVSLHTPMAGTAPTSGSFTYSYTASGSNVRIDGALRGAIAYGTFTERDRFSFQNPNQTASGGPIVCDSHRISWFAETPGQ